jgi:hypothetical protein
LTFGYFYDYFVRSCRMKNSENNKTAADSRQCSAGELGEDK